MGIKMVHKFDKMNAMNCGMFHPRGNEVIINSEVVRSFFIFCFRTNKTCSVM